MAQCHITYIVKCVVIAAAAYNDGNNDDDDDRNGNDHDDSDNDDDDNGDATLVITVASDKDYGDVNCMSIKIYGPNTHLLAK